MTDNLNGLAASVALGHRFCVTIEIVGKKSLDSAASAETLAASAFTFT